MKKIFKCCVLVSILGTTIHAKTFNEDNYKKCTECGLCSKEKSSAEFYDVKKNDTLGDIAKKLGIGVDQIVGLNNIKNPNLIYPRTKLKISRNNDIVHKIHTVKKNETLNEIAKKNNVDIKKLVEINNIENPNLIYPGMRLCIDNQAKDFVNYKVQKDDTLGKIASKLDVNIEEIIELNDIKNPNLIYYGQLLKIPSYNKVVKVETTPQSYVEVSRNDEIIAHQSTYEEEIISIEDENLKAGDELSLKVYNNQGEIEEKEIKVSNEKITFISFIDNNKNGLLDLEDILITDGTLEIDGKTVGISPLGKTEISDLEIGKTYDITVNSMENNIENRKTTMKLTEEKIFVPIKNDFFALKGNIKLVGKSLFSKNSDIYENLLLRIKNKSGEEILFLPIDKLGNFYIDRIVQGDYYYDIEEITNSKLKTLEKNKKFSINNSNNIELELKIKNRLF